MSGIVDEVGENIDHLICQISYICVLVKDYNPDHSHNKYLICYYDLTKLKWENKLVRHDHDLTKREKLLKHGN